MLRKTRTKEKKMNTEKKNFKDLETVEVRKIWSHEEKEFTPWLSSQENITKYIAPATGMDLELIRTEFPVGSLEADIVCTNNDNKERVVIENKLTKANNKDITQLLEYLAGLKLKTGILIAKDFDDRVVAFIDWFNNNADINLFGLKVEANKIGNSDIAVSFKTVCKPNNWSKNANERTSDLSETEKVNLRFFDKVCEKIAEDEIDLEDKYYASGRVRSFDLGYNQGRRLAIVPKTRDNKLRVECYLPDETELFDFLQNKKVEIENKFGQSLVWERLDDKKASRIFIELENFDLSIEGKMDFYRNKTVQSLMNFKNTLPIFIDQYDLQKRSLKNVERKAI